MRHLTNASFMLLVLCGILFFSRPSFSADLPRLSQLEETLVRYDDQKAFSETLEHIVFRANAIHIPPQPYRPTPMVYDGVVTAISHQESLAFITCATWLTNAESIELILPDKTTHPLRLEHIDHRFDLALLRPEKKLPQQVKVNPSHIAERTSLSVYTLLSPHTPMQTLAHVHLLKADPKIHPFYQVAKLPVINGYPLLNAKGELISLISIRSSKNPKTQSFAVPKTQLQAFLLSLEKDEKGSHLDELFDPNTEKHSGFPFSDTKR